MIRRSDSTSVDGQCRGRAHGGDYDSNGDGYYGYMVVVILVVVRLLLMIADEHDG